MPADHRNESRKSMAGRRLAAGGAWQDPPMLFPFLRSFASGRVQELAGHKIRRGRNHSRPAASPGYAVFSPLRARQTYLVDSRGEIVQPGDTPHPPLSVYLRDDGKLLRGA